MIEHIIYSLNMLNFFDKKALDDDTLHRMVAYLKGEDKVEPIGIMPSQIEEVDNKVLKLTLLRNASNVIVDSPNTLRDVRKKKTYKFDHVFNENQLSDIVECMKEFIDRRISACVDTTLYLHGYSKSGKTTLTQYLLMEMRPVGEYILYEIYNNNIYVYAGNNIKLRVSSLDDVERYKFKTNDITGKLSVFNRKSNNGINENSSRSHVVLVVYYDKNVKITIIDAAGCENLKCKTTSKEIVEQSKYINASLTNARSWLVNSKFRKNNCKLLSVLKSASNLIFCLMMTDNESSIASNFLSLFKDILK